MIRLRIVENVHPAKAFPLTELISKIIDDEASRMQEAHKELETQFCHVFARLPGRPEILNGRTSDLMKYVRLLCGAVPARIVIIGPEDIGKTSLAKALLYNEEVVDVFGDLRVFVSVEGVIDMEGAIAQLAKQLGVQHPTDPLSASISFFMSLPRVLLVIDNLETLWFSKDDSAQAGTAQLFRCLKDITSLTIIVTCRSGTTPDGIIWSNESSAELRSISLGAAYDTFVKLSRPPEITAEEVSLKGLLQAVDCVPLAVTLLARLAKLPGKSPEHTKMMAKTSDRGREFNVNVEVSIQVSLDFLAYTGVCAEAEQLLFVCALLPDGLRPEVFEQMSDFFKNITGAKDLLLTFALVSLGRDGEPLMLSPVRHFVLSQSSVKTTAPQRVSENFTSRAEYGNLSSYLLHLIDREEPSEELFDALTAASNYLYWTNPLTALLDAFRPRLEGHSRWLARCLEAIGRICLQRCEFSLCAPSLLQAVALFEGLAIVDSQIWCKCMLGQSLRYLGRFEDALQELLAAQALMSEIEGSLRKGVVHRDLVLIYFSLNEYEAAVNHYVTATAEFLRTGQRLNAAQCSDDLESIALQQDRLPAAEFDLQFALSEFEALGH
ncbi:hypothetical protein BKA62DRAFT_808019 [Auriculariales sp. MPI-PUGE-AT-0066]|nr:hypothetical protein BKA62DRAFT_808019 [Auriculariales sp. MPI-PUGE-AT-0066]